MAEGGRAAWVWAEGTATAGDSGGQRGSAGHRAREAREGGRKRSHGYTHHGSVYYGDQKRQSHRQKDTVGVGESERRQREVQREVREKEGYKNKCWTAGLLGY